MWVLDHLDDLDADFRRFYGIAGIGREEFGDLSGPEFLSLAYRVGAYGGVMAVMAQEDDPHAGATPQAVGGATDGETTVVRGDRRALKTTPTLAELIDF